MDKEDKKTFSEIKKKWEEYREKSESYIAYVKNMIIGIQCALQMRYPIRVDLEGLFHSAIVSCFCTILETDQECRQTIRSFSREKFAKRDEKLKEKDLDGAWHRTLVRRMERIRDSLNLQQSMAK